MPIPFCLAFRFWKLSPGCSSRPLGRDPPCWRQVPGAWYTHRQPPMQQQWVADGRVVGAEETKALICRAPLSSRFAPGPGWGWNK